MNNTEPLATLTAQERVVLSCVAQGYSNERIARRLSVTERTVETHTRRIFSKLGLEASPSTHRRVLAAVAHIRATGLAAA